MAESRLRLSAIRSYQWKRKAFLVDFRKAYGAASLLAEIFLVTRKFHRISFAFKSWLVFPIDFSTSYCSPPGQVFPAPFTL